MAQLKIEAHVRRMSAFYALYVAAYGATEN
jgi:hypothetical protein